MAGYVDPDLLDDETAVAEGNLAAMADHVEGWDPFNGQIEPPLAEASAITAATIVAEIKDDQRNNYTGIGERIFQVVRNVAQPATSTATIVLTDDLGHTVTAGFTFVALTPDEDSVTLITLEDAVVSVGETTISGVRVAAVNPVGEDGNDASGDAIDFDELGYVSTVTLVEPTSDGVDEEDVPSYLDRIVRRSRRRSLLPTTPANYADEALDVPGIARCLALNKTDPDNPGEQLGHLTLVPATSDGEEVSGAVEDALVAHFDAMDHLLPVELHVIPPTTVNVDVYVKARLADGVVEADAEAAIEAAVRAYLNPAVYNLDPDSPGRWRRSAGEITIFDVDRQLRPELVPEVKQVVEVTLDAGTAPIDLDPEALVSADTVTVEIVA